MSHDDTLRALRDSLRDLQQERTSSTEFCRSWRSQGALLAALPPRFGQVMEDLLGRLESSSMFSGESCSYSHEDLHASLGVWLDKAGVQLTGGDRANA